MSNTELEALINSKLPNFRKGDIVDGTILEIRPQVVLVDIGYKSEGVIPVSEFEDEEIEEGDQIEVLLVSGFLSVIMRMACSPSPAVPTT